MNQNINVEASLLSALQPYLSKKTNTSSVLLSVLMILSGCVSIYWGLDLSVSSDIISMGLLTLGTILLLISLYHLFWNSKEWVYLSTGSKIIFGSCYADTNEMKNIRDVLEKKKNELGFFPDKASGNIRLDYLLTKDRRFIAVQLFMFVPYTYEPVSEVYQYQEDEARTIIRYLKKINN